MEGSVVLFLLSVLPIRVTAISHIPLPCPLLSPNYSQYLLIPSRSTANFPPFSAISLCNYREAGGLQHSRIAPSSRCEGLESWRGSRARRAILDCSPSGQRWIGELVIAHTLNTASRTPVSRMARVRSEGARKGWDGQGRARRVMAHPPSLYSASTVSPPPSSRRSSSGGRR